MKEILFICECHYYRLAFKDFLEREKGYTIEFDTLGSLVGRYVGHKTALIHLTENNYTEIFLFFENNGLYFTENITFITNKRLITLLSRFFDKRLRFIDELSILDKYSNTEVFEENIESKWSLSQVNEQLDLLTISEFLVLSLLLAGLTPTTIAFRTKKSIKTISSQKVGALRKLDLDNTPHSLIKLAHIFRFATTLDSINRRDATREDVVCSYEGTR